MLWRLRYKLALRGLPELFALRGIVFSHQTVHGREAKLTPSLADDLRRRRRGKAGRSWSMDEPYLKVDGRWCYLYRAIDRTGAGGRAVQRALEHQGRPCALPPGP